MTAQAVVRPEVTGAHQEQAWVRLEGALARVIQRRGHRGAYAGSHETLGMVTEEYIELVGAVRTGPPARVVEELLDVAVAALWGVASALARGEGQ